MPSFVADRVVQTPADLVWAVVADLAGYAQIAPGLSDVEILGGDREGLRRRCYDARGRGWNEVCTLWEPGHRYQMRVDTTSYPFPLRQLLRAFQGTWSVDPVPGGTRITVRFDAQPRLGLLGRLALRAITLDASCGLPLMAPPTRPALLGGEAQDNAVDSILASPARADALGNPGGGDRDHSTRRNGPGPWRAKPGYGRHGAGHQGARPDHR